MSGQKGSDVYSADQVGDDLLVLSTLLVRGADKKTIQDSLRKVLAAGSVDDPFVLTFMTRAIRGGKGERKLFYQMWEIIMELRPRLAIFLLDLIPHYGGWFDLFEMAPSWPSRRPLYDLVERQLIADEKAVLAGTKASLLCKWLPREGKPLAGELADYLGYKTQSRVGRLASYRKRVASVNRYLKTTEIAMCAGKWAEIKPEVVPARCIQQHKKAFLNEIISRKGSTKGSLRHPTDADRMACREHFQNYFRASAKGEIVAKGADTLYPHEIVEQLRVAHVYGGKPISLDEEHSLIGSWNAFVTRTKEGGGLGRSIPMCDFSGSMNGLPLQVSLALGLLISEVTTDAFKGRMLTFDSTPKWIQFSEADGIVGRIKAVNASGYGQGLSTDFQAAMDMVLATLKRKRVAPGQEPENLIVLTDMAWDQACGSSQNSKYTGASYRHVVKTAPWQTHIQMIREAFKRAGEDMFGEGNGWTPPRIVIWNLSPNCQDMHAKADEEGVMMLSGWSPSNFKVLMAKGPEVQTPLGALRAQLDDSMYDLVRERIAEYNLMHKLTT
uniref:DUF7788 domain-containing protein n=1 Tax=viral metagenome TaxID=1070528 RepID=A0A6C0IAI0_9ZZZZ